MLIACGLSSGAGWLLFGLKEQRRPSETAHIGMLVCTFSVLLCNKMQSPMHWLSSN